MKLNANYSKENTEKIKKLYTDAFPKIERKPFDLILEKCDMGLMEILTIESDNNDFLGLAITIIYKDMVLLDYFAIAPESRGKSYGSNALNLLFEKYKNRRFVLEIENPNIKCDNQEERTRRKTFYTHNGMTAMQYKVNLMGVQMEVLTHNCNVTFEEYHNIYGNTFSDEISRKVQLIEDC